jgi:DNA-binding response OmpR family regulator
MHNPTWWRRRFTSLGVDMTNVLVVDDEPDILRFIQRGLMADGHTVTVSSEGADGLRVARQQRPKVIILDLMMPGLDGRAVLKELVSTSPAPRVIVLSGMADVRTRVGCLEAGAADFLLKPFAMAELIARVHAQTRSYRSDEAPDALEAGRLTLDLVQRTLYVDGRSVTLTNREFLLLQHLMGKPDVTCTREELLSEVWGYSFDPGTNVVDACVRRLRSKIKSDAIDTIRNVGYTLRSA